jgi:ATPase subunit of ABC transporter with duplicated ATPase domains
MTRSHSERELSDDQRHRPGVARGLAHPLGEANLRVQPGDRIGLVGRNGAGKTTTLKVMAGEGTPHAGTVERRGAVGYLPQDPRTGDLTITARDRVLSARGLDTILAEMKQLEQ